MHGGTYMEHRVFVFKNASALFSSLLYFKTTFV